MRLENILSGRFLFYWSPVIFYLGLIYYFSSLSLSGFKSPFPYYDKAIHFMEYAILAILLYRAFHYSIPAQWEKFTGILVVALCIGYGLLDEFHQSFVPSRSSEVFDLMADTLGAVVGTVLVSFFIPLKGKK